MQAGRPLKVAPGRSPPQAARSPKKAPRDAPLKAPTCHVPSPNKGILEPLLSMMWPAMTAEARKPRSKDHAAVVQMRPSGNRCDGKQRGLRLAAATRRRLLIGPPAPRVRPLELRQGLVGRTFPLRLLGHDPRSSKRTRQPLWCLEMRML